MAHTQAAATDCSKSMWSPIGAHLELCPSGAQAEPKPAQLVTMIVLAVVGMVVVIIVEIVIIIIKLIVVIVVLIRVIVRTLK